MELIDREDHQKLYLQLFEILKKKIESKEWPLGSQMPIEEELCRMYSVSRATVRTAVLELVRQGYLKRQQGKGTFIYRNVISEGLTMYTSLGETLLDKSEALTPNILARTVMMPVDDLDVKLDISPDKHIIYIKRLWLDNKQPVIVQEIYIPYNVCPLLLEDNIETHPLFELFEKKYGIKITRVTNKIDMTYLTADESRILGLAEGSVSLVATQQFYSGDTLIIYMRSVKSPNHFQIFFELERKVL